ncbi:glycine zipper 2TM domain-containing protein [Pedomonas mirosovicensis]|uniref:glycine zipper 2TM domain-containing protein n=1 Tax=Pedomonas mirosovicensis TaxID=2908641 RepID=UPI00216905B5|nr:glycine zipper 2TM domain-containing protein [Pedomonas mirosovicensis]MCH8685867.1 glycine zipper 2TM domain-containing protein [Pedomonas mirosovicensis]
MKRASFLIAAVICSMSLTACASNDYGHRGDRPGYGKRYDDRYRNHDRRDRRHRAERRQLRDNDVIYRGRDGRYYCKKDDGTTGTIVGAIGGGVLGNLIAPGGSKTLGTILGAGAGALAGRAIDRGDIHCE